MKRIALLALAILLAEAGVAADADNRFHGGSYDGYAQNSVLDAPVRIPSGTLVMIR